MLCSLLDLNPEHFALAYFPFPTRHHLGIMFGAYNPTQQYSKLIQSDEGETTAEDARGRSKMFCFHTPRFITVLFGLFMATILSAMVLIITDQLSKQQAFLPKRTLNSPVLYILTTECVKIPNEHYYMNSDYNHCGIPTGSQIQFAKITRK